MKISAREFPLLANILFGADASLPWLGSPPADNRVVVVGPRICDDIPRIIVRPEAWALWIVPECELKNCHSGKAEAMTNSFHFRSDDSEIFGENRQRADLSFNGGEQFFAWAFDPLPILGRLLAARYLPIGFEAPEVVDAQHVENTECRAKAVDPP